MAAAAQKQALHLSVKAVAEAAKKNANIPMGSLQEHKGYLKIMSSSEREENAFLKFPVESLDTQDVITGGALRVFQFGKGSGPLIVKLSSCAWTKKEITYTNSQHFAGKTVSSGDGAAFADAKIFGLLSH